MVSDSCFQLDHKWYTTQNLGKSIGNWTNSDLNFHWKQLEVRHLWPYLDSADSQWGLWKPNLETGEPGLNVPQLSCFRPFHQIVSHKCCRALKSRSMGMCVGLMTGQEGVHLPVKGVCNCIHYSDWTFKDNVLIIYKNYTLFVVVYTHFTSI